MGVLLRFFGVFRKSEQQQASTSLRAHVLYPLASISRGTCDLSLSCQYLLTIPSIGRNPHIYTRIQPHRQTPRLAPSISLQPPPKTMSGAELPLAIAGVVLAWKGILDMADVLITLCRDDDQDRSFLHLRVKVARS